VQALRSELGRGGSALAPVPGSGSGAPALTADAVGRLLAMEEELRRLRGRMDELVFAQQRAAEDTRKALEDLQFRITELEGRRAAPTNPPGATAPAAPRPAPPAPAAPPGRTPEQALAAGNAALARRDYAAAEAAAREVIANRQSPRAYDAQFLLAQSLAGRRAWQEAALAYDEAYRRNRAGSRAPDSLLGLAEAFLALSENRSACATLAQLQSEFPGGRADLRDRIAAARQRGGCRT
jgi:TolA-binding protein